MVQDIPGNFPGFEYEIIKNGTITTVPNFLSASCHCGIRKIKDDLSLIFTEGATVCSAVFTKNKFAAAPVLVSKKQLAKNRNINAIIINSGIANACTGAEGIINAEKTIESAAGLLGISKENIIVSSTGRIGKHIPVDKIEKGLNLCAKKLGAENGHITARAILTIDKNPKEFALKFQLNGKEVFIGGIAKGSVMVEPDMATTLCFIATDADVEPELLDKILFECIDNTFNCITTDGCQSTNDMAVIIANGKSGVNIGNNEYGLSCFKEALMLCLDNLSRKVVEDAEGATKFVELAVEGSKSVGEARNIGKKVANSILFKSAMYGEDVNWGRIAAAVGSIDNEIDNTAIDIHLGDLIIMKNGMAVEYDQDYANRLIRERYIKFTINMNSGNCRAKILTNDISYEYIKINALYKKQK